MLIELESFLHNFHRNFFLQHNVVEDDLDSLKSELLKIL